MLQKLILLLVLAVCLSCREGSFGVGSVSSCGFTRTNFNGWELVWKGAILKIMVPQLLRGSSFVLIASALKNSTASRRGTMRVLPTRVFF